MKHTKLLLLSLLFALTPLLASAQTIFFGWSAFVGYSGGSNVSIFAPTKQGCIAQYNSAIYNPPPGQTVDYSKTSPCRRMYEELPVLVDQFEWDDCQVCGVINENILKRIYPHHFREALSIMRDYELNTYQKELNALQKQFDLSGYQDAMSEFEQSIAQ